MRERFRCAMVAGIALLSGLGAEACLAASPAVTLLEDNRSVHIKGELTQFPAGTLRFDRIEVPASPFADFDHAISDEVIGSGICGGRVGAEAQQTSTVSSTIINGQGHVRAWNYSPCPDTSDGISDFKLTFSIDGEFVYHLSLLGYGEFDGYAWGNLKNLGTGDFVAAGTGVLQPGIYQLSAGAHANPDIGPDWDDSTAWYDASLALDPIPAPIKLSSVSLASSVVAGCKSVTGTVTLSTSAPAEGVVVQLSDTLASASLPATVTVPSGATTRTFIVKTVPVSANQAGAVSATLDGTILSQPLTVRPIGLSSVSLTPAAVVGSIPVVGKATLECKAGPGPIEMVLGSSNAIVAYPVAPSIFVPVGMQSVPFDVDTNSVLAKASATISGKANGITKSKVLTVNVAAAVSPTSLKFGNVPINTASVVQSTTLYNKGTVSYVIGGITLTGTNAKYYAQTNNCGVTLEAGASCTIGVTFTPTVTGIKSAKLSIATSATATPLSVGLSGTGVLPP